MYTTRTAIIHTKFLYIPQHIPLYLLSLLTPHHKNLPSLDHDFTRKFKEFERALLEIFMISVFNRMLLTCNRAHVP